jgi:hypothetical protein
MESLPFEPGKQTTYKAVYSDVGRYCHDLSIQIDKTSFERALKLLHVEQCLVYFNNSDIRPTQYGLNRYK